MKKLSPLVRRSFFARYITLCIALTIFTPLLYAQIEVIDPHSTVEERSHLPKDRPFMGVFQENGKPVTKKIKGSIKKVTEYNQENLRWVFNNQKNLIFAIDGIPLKEGPILGRGLVSQGILKDGEKIHTGIGDSSLYMDGNMRKKDDGTDPRFTPNGFKLYVIFNKKNYLFYDSDYDRSSFIYVKWIGDLNNDGFPDFIFHLSFDEKHGDEHLYLSEKINGEYTIKKAATFEHEGC